MPANTGRVIAALICLYFLHVTPVDAQKRVVPGAGVTAIGDGLENTLARFAKPVVFYEDSFGWIAFDAIASEGDGYPGFVVDEKINWDTIAEITEPEESYVLDLRFAATDDDYLKPLAVLKNVFALGLAETGVTDIGLGHLRGYANLEHLDVSGNFVTDNALTTLKQLEKLRRLDLANTRITNEGMKTIAQFRALHALRVNGTEVTGTGLTELASLKSLDTLAIALKTGSASGLGTLAGLTTLDLSGSDLTNDEVAEIGKLKKLRELGLADLPIDDDGLSKLNGLDLRLLAIGGTRIQGSALSGFANLEVLDASFSAINDQGLESLATEKLTLLNLYETSITDAAIPKIARQIHLVELGVGKTEITNVGVELLINMPELQALNFDGCKGINDSTIELLLKIPKLTSLDLSNTSLTAGALNAMREFKSLRYLNLSPTGMSSLDIWELQDSLPDCEIR